MLRPLAGFVLIVLALAGAAAADHDTLSDSGPLAPATLQPLHLAWFDPRVALPGSFSAVSREVTKAFRGLGIAVSWRVGRVGDEMGTITPDEVSVIFLPSNPQGRDGRPGVMGRVQRSQQPPRGAWVFVSEVRRVLCPPQMGNHFGDPRESPDLPLALARVVVHEVVHAIVPEEPHEDTGLMQDKLDRAVLVGRRPTVGSGCAQALLRGLATSHQNSVVATNP